MLGKCSIGVGSGGGGSSVAQQKKIRLINSERTYNMQGQVCESYKLIPVEVQVRETAPA